MSDAKEGKEQSQSGGTKKVVVVAMVMNALIAIAKFIVGILIGSSSLLAEGAHSVGDTANEVFLFLSLKKADDPPDEAHPFGHGQERFFWSFFAAMFIFFAGAVFSFFEGVEKILSSEGGSNSEFIAGYVVLAVAFMFESVSYVVSIREVRRKAKEEGHSFREELRTSRNTTLKLPVFEDTAALIGILLAAGGLVLTQFTGNSLFDGLGSIAIGLLLTALAWVIGSDSHRLLLGQAMLPEDRRKIHEVMVSFPEVQGVIRLLTMHLSPETSLVNAEINVADNLDADQVEELMERIDKQIRQQVPEVRETFIELHSETKAPTPAERE